MEASTENFKLAEVSAIPQGKALSKKQRNLAIGGVAGVFALAYLAKFIYGAWAYEETDDAHTSANSTVLASKVGGVVTEVLARENQRVKAGDVLLRLDPRDLKNRVEQVEAELGSVQATLGNAAKDNSRMKTLLSTDSVSVQQADGASAKYQELARKESSLKAQLKQAQLDLEYTEVRAPTDGRVGRRAVEMGTVVGPGQPIVAFVQSTEYWVVANFKETQLQHMKIGQKVEVNVDAIADHTFEGTIESFSPGSGSTFAIIPPDNATGNFVKVVQRVPVRIALNKEALTGYEERFVPGLSVMASVKVK